MFTDSSVNTVSIKVQNDRRTNKYGQNQTKLQFKFMSKKLMHDK